MGRNGSLPMRPWRPFQGPHLADFGESRNNNFNLIRLVAASGVLVSHSFPIALGPQAIEPLSELLGISLGGLSVIAFFGISGFLIARSMERSTIKRFLAARFLRLFPGLFIVLLLTAFVVGPLLTVAPADDYWSTAPLYVLRNASLYALQYPLPGVFADNPFGPAINGSLWTLKHEVTCYLGVAVIGPAGVLGRRDLMAAALIAFVAVYAFIEIVEIHPHILTLARLAVPFATGVALHVWSDRVPLSLNLGVLLFATAAALRFTPLFGAAVSVALVYGVVLAAYLPNSRIRGFNQFGDYSYGVYIYAFPIQQLVVAKFGPMTPFQNIAFSFPLVLFCAILSWSLVEKPALGLIRRRSKSAAA